MGVTKRVLFGRESELEPIRRQLGEKNWRRNSQFAYRLPRKRRNATQITPHWHPSWPNSLATAANELEIEFVNINGGMFFRTAEDARRVKTLAETMWKKRIMERTQTNS